MDLNKHFISRTLLVFILATFFSTALTRHRIRHHRDRFKRQQGAHLYLPGSYILAESREQEAGPWSEWESPSECSRTCGGGVAVQFRRCHYEGACHGSDRKYFSCNTQDCPDNGDYRAQQCAEFDRIPFEGVYYQWIPYTKAPNQCELNCMPRGERFYYRHKKQVADGTRCNEDSLDVCVDGQCQPVGCDMMLGSHAREDKCRQCGGNGTTCHTVSGFFDNQDLSVGYNDILLIPAGATNIDVRERSPSNNYLAVRNTTGHYYLNGNWRIDFPKTLRFAGCNFHYERSPQGFAAPDSVTCIGPIYEPLFIVLLYQDTNVGVNYEYSVPKAIASDPETYSWIYDEFSPCSSTCGGGYQTRNVSCAGRRSLEIVSKSLCDPSTEPVAAQPCGEGPCDPQWVPGPWSECSEVCGGNGVQTREIKCERVISSGVSSAVNEQYCTQRGLEKPEAIRDCNRDTACPLWFTSPWKPCDHLCGEGKETREVICYRKVDGKIEVLDNNYCEQKEPKPESEKTCNLRPCEGVDWVASEWSGCDKCGLDSETRKIHCATQKGEIYPDTLCEGETKPEIVRKCEKLKQCDNQWYASQWSECSANCGSGVQTRNVFCGTFEEEALKKVPDEQCDEKLKYDSLRNCTAEQTECAGEWFSGPWSKCDKECGSGTKTRKVLCMKEEKVIPVSNCDGNIIPFTNEQCNEKPCGDDETLPVNTTKSVEEVDKETSDSLTTTGLMTTGSPEWDPDKDIEIIDDDECLDGEWQDVDEDYEEEDEFEDLARLQEEEESTPFSSSLSTESSSLFSDDDGLMLSDSTYSTDESSADTSPFTEEGSGESTSPIDESTPVSSSVDTSPVSGSTLEGSGESEGTTIEGVTGSDSSTMEDVTGSSDSSTIETETGATSETSITGSEMTSESVTGETTVSDGASTEETKETSDGTTELPGTDISGSTVDSTDSSTDSSSSSSSLMTDSSDLTTSSDSITTDKQDESSSMSTTTSDDTSSPSSSETPTTETTPDYSTETSYVTDTSDLTSTTDLSSSSTSDATVTTLATSDSLETTTSSATEETAPQLPAESNFGEEDDDDDDADKDQTTILPGTTSSDMDVSGTTSSDEATDGTDITTESGPTTDTSGSTVESSTETDIDVTTVSGSTVEVSGSTEETQTTETDDGMTTPTEMTSESGPTETTETSVTETSVTETSMSTEETESSSVYDIWSTTESSYSTDMTEATSESEESESSTWGTTPYTIESITKAHKRICVRRKPAACKKTPFGCCYDMVTPAQGPFDKGCPIPKTCNETKYGCCKDNVSPATGPKFLGCPKTDCKDTLYGCCPDNKTPAEGNNNEGCIKEPKCFKAKYGCCADNSTKAQGPNRMGCKECGKYGCCPDGVSKASGKNNKGCPKPKEDCAKTKYGCCPDGETAAGGEHFKGCDIINKDNCTASYYGCCPDGVSPAYGPEYQGCRMACEDEQYGCCPDRVTAAHGPNQEGCCLVHAYGCCPDNILPARGPNLEGCGCQYSPYGCCPDNVTAARGHGNEGCGCQHTEHGCCTDRYTPAAGPNNQGCACHTFQFGCCPDGVTIAKGPHQQGCGCRNTEHGCCSDDQTPAQGPNFAGCDCSSSKYGCCPDGYTDAQGENFEGCTNVPPNKQEVCSLTRDRGSCNNYTVKWFFDMEYGGCSRFWYGGCEGNANRFHSMEECKDICIEPTGKEICQLPKVTGACEGYYPSWYYDKERKQCAQFIWGGCLGNSNRFETREECQSLCHVDRDQDTCEQPREQGSCNGNYRRWYFNKDANRCEQFAYGGCKGNNNNFPTEMACRQQCLQPGRKKDVCALPRAPGSCSQREPRWYFDASENRCMPFYYTGCEGNNNRFTSREACEFDCPTVVERDACTLPALTGSCFNYVERWYYDTNEKRCRLFYYGGCDGNDNNFVSEQACLQRCEQQQTTPAPASPEHQVPAFQREHCFLANDTGPCRSSVARWFYDSRDGVCKQFLYGGCQGNGNNFESREECYHRCGNVQDVCDLPMVVGPCNSDYLQWFYDRQTDTCQMFNYGGCQGNENRFNDQESCEQRCKKSHEPVTHAPPGPEEYYTRAPQYGGERPSSEVQICYAPIDVGNCSGNEPSYYYDAANQQCKTFVYTGCGGNANRFVSEEQCQRHCGSFRGLDVCSHPRETGNCQAAIIKWYYDRETQQCQQFHYGGCGGSGNRFSSLEECESVCFKSIEPPLKPSVNNDTNESHSAICLLPVEVGPCEGQHHQMRWHFDEERHNCISFIYSGCGGNKNNFRTYQQCMETCRNELGRLPSQNEIDVEERPEKSVCDEYRDECTSLLCPYGTEGFVDEDHCNRCRCYEPCRDTHCPDETVCKIDLNPNAMLPDETQFIAICRPIHKEGLCPQVSGIHDCAQECRSDVDCSGDFKCCSTGCGTACVVPYVPQLPTASAYTEAPHISRGVPPEIIDPHEETELSAEEGSYILLRCSAQGNPHPTITWYKGHELLDGSKARQRVLSDGSLQLVGLDKADAGIYSCIADNGVGNTAQKDIKLDVTEPTPHSANVVGEDDTKITVTLGAPYYLRCFAYGWPRPTVTWWRGDSMLPMSSDQYEQKRDYTLLIRSVRLSNLGIYTCQAYNGLGKAASWSLTVQSLGPVYSENPEDEPFKKFLIEPAQLPPATTTTPAPRPMWPFRPTRPPVAPEIPPKRPPPPPPPPPQPQPTYHYPESDPYSNNIVEPEETPRVYIVPVRTNITLNRNVFPVDSEISIPCDVDGHPVPRVQWYKNGVPVENNENIQISESHRLTIGRATISDSGKYDCEAENEYSKSSSSVNISVEGIYIHPNCTDNPFFANCGLIVQARYCTHKYYARFCCLSCTQAGQLPSYGPHLVADSRQSERTSNYL